MNGQPVLHSSVGAAAAGVHRANGVGHRVDTTRARPHLQLLGEFRVSIGGRDCTLPVHAQRLVGYLALHPGAGDRCSIAVHLWLDVEEVRARRQLRDALWQVRRAAPGLLAHEADRVCLDDAVVVDVRHMLEVAQLLVSGTGDWVPDGAVQLLAVDLLTGWSDEWVTVERERLRHLRLHALEALSRRYTRTGSHAAAVDAALVAVAAEPLRESAQRVLLEAHLAEGNVSEAAYQLGRYRELLRTALDVEPSAQLVGLVAAELSSPTR
jgi:DNA-binding SARP family transcriptional activator